MTPDDLQLTARLVAAGRIHSVSDEAVTALARRVLWLDERERNLTAILSDTVARLNDMEAERDLAQRAATHWEGVAVANALEVVTEVAAERETCARMAESFSPGQYKLATLIRARGLSGTPQLDDVKRCGA
jgi:hypothetical protein